MENLLIGIGYVQLSHQAGQKERNLREKQNDRIAYKQGKKHGENPPKYDLQWHILCHTMDHIHIDTHWR
ncbi:MAG TPA: hypothetical protein VMW90_02170, partial [Acidobacteriota bacterium]|nr:hypothetical protein [Acidobacteriota bacterium]